jgi:hypothetical protein
MTRFIRSATERFAALALRDGVSLGGLQRASAEDFALVLAAAACAFPPAFELSERAVNEILKSFLAGAGSMLGTDHVELRRSMVDHAVLARDGFGRLYTRGFASEAIARHAAAFAGIDLAALAQEARARETARRKERKARWLATRSGADG